MAGEVFQLTCLELQVKILCFLSIQWNDQNIWLALPLVMILETDL